MLAKTMTTKQHYWLDHVKAAANSGGTIAEYALANGIRLKTLYQWKTKLVKLGHYKLHEVATDSDFIQVKSSTVEAQQPNCKINFPSGIQIEFTCEMDNKSIRSIITSVSGRR